MGVPQVRDHGRVVYVNVRAVKLERLCRMYEPVHELKSLEFAYDTCGRARACGSGGTTVFLGVYGGCM